MAQSQAPPYDREAEEATIGALLVDPDAIARVLATGLQPGDFHLMPLRLIFRAIMELHERDEPADYILVLAELKRRDLLKDVGGPAGVTALITRCPTSIYATHYANVVARCALQRRMIALAGQVAKTAYEGNGSIHDLRKAVRDLAETATDDDTNTVAIKGVLR